MLHKVGIYVRVSTEEQSQVADGSIESQQHRVRSFVDIKNHQEKNWGKVVETYIDDGYSAKNTNRPAYQRMFKDIRSGKINMILMTDLSRLSRSIADFCLLLKELEKFKAKFLSIKEQFDTSTPAGEMMIFNMINLAQFERKQTSERISLNFHSRAMRGLVNGGGPLLGFDKDPTNPGRLLVNEEEAKLVRYIFDLYLEEGSLSKTAQRLNTEKINRKDGDRKNARHVADGRWTTMSVQRFLKNYSYAGLREVNKGNKLEVQSSLKTWQQYQIVDASWPSIVDRAIFNRVQSAIEKARESERRRFSASEKRIFLASGMLRCGHCNRALIGQAAHGRSQVHRYYGHKLTTGEKIECPIKRIPASDIEDAIIKHLDQVILSVGYLDQIEANIEKSVGTNKSASKSKKDLVEKSISTITSEIDSVFKLLIGFSDNTAANDLVKDRLQTLAIKKKELESELDCVVSDEYSSVDTKEAKRIIEDRVLDFKRGWKKANPNQQKKLVRRIFNQLILTESGLQAYYSLAEDSKEIGSDLKKQKPLGSNPDGRFSSLKKPMDFLVSNGSPVVTNGGFVLPVLIITT